MSDRISCGYGVLHVTPLPGLPQVAVVHGVWVPDHKRGYGLGHKLMETCTDYVRGMTYDFAICTTADSNIAMQRCLRRAGWCVSHTFHNSHSGGLHQMWRLDIRSVAAQGGA